MSELEPEAGLDFNGIGLPTVTVETEYFTAEAVAFFAMPGMKVFEVMMSGDDERGARIFELFKLSINNPEKISQMEVLTFGEIQSIMAQWMMLSNMLQHEETETIGGTGTGEG